MTGNDETTQPGTVVPASHFRIADFLPSDDHRQIKAYAASPPRPLEAARIEGRDSAAAHDDSVRRARIVDVADEAWQPFEARIMQMLPLLLPTTDERHVQIERGLLRYDDGDFYGVHYDNGGLTGRGRLLTFVYYFSVEPNGFEGGELWLHDALIDADGTATPADTYTCVEPADNSIVFFPSDVYHQVRPVRSLVPGLAGSRFAVNGWIRSERADSTD